MQQQQGFEESRARGKKAGGAGHQAGGDVDQGVNVGRRWCRGISVSCPVAAGGWSWTTGRLDVDGCLFDLLIGYRKAPAVATAYVNWLETTATASACV